MSVSSRRLRNIFINGIVLIAALIVAAFLLELVVRVSGLQPMASNPHLHQVSSVGGLVFELIPDLHTPGYNRETVTTNAQGFRSPPINPAKPNIVVIGDSMTFGLGVEDNQTNPAVLQEHFPAYNVINMGVSSYNMEQEARAYTTKGKQFDPKLVILEFVMNDADAKAHYENGVFTTENVTAQQQEALTKAAITKEGTWHIPFKIFLHEHSVLFTFIERRTKGMWFRAKISVLGNEWTPDMKAYYQTWFDQLDKAVGNRPKLLVRWPDNWLHPDTVAWLDQLAAAHGWKIVNLGDLFGVSYPTLGWDQHPNPSTQRKAAEAVQTFIDNDKILPSGLPSGTGSVR